MVFTGLLGLVPLPFKPHKRFLRSKGPIRLRQKRILEFLYSPKTINFVANLRWGAGART